MSNREVKTIFRTYTWNEVGTLGEPQQKERSQSRSANALANFERHLDPVVRQTPAMAVSIALLQGLIRNIDGGNV